MPRLPAASSPWPGQPARELRALLLVALVATASAAEVSVRITDQKAAPVADAIVSLTPLDTTAPAPSATPPVPVEIVQDALEFLPYVTPVRVGTPIVFPNRDTVQHHVYSVSKPKKFELPLYMPGKAETVVFDEPGHVVIGCNIHDWMSAHVLVLDTPWFAKTGDDGVAVLSAAPTGRYRAEVWHPRLAKSVTREITVADGASLSTGFELTLRPDRRIRRGPATKGGGYR